MARPRPVPREGAPSITVYLNADPNHWPNVPRGESPGQYLKHPLAITHFDREGRAVWPDDQFTRRRIRDGDVMIEAPKEVPKAATRRVEHKAQ